MTHPSEEDLVDYLHADLTDAEQRATLKEHLASCGACGTTAREYGVIIEALSEPLPTGPMPPSARSVQFVADLRHAQTVLEEGRRQARLEIERARARTPDWAPAWADELSPTEGTVYTLLELARAEVEREPRAALDLATHAARLSERLPHDLQAAHRAWLCGTAFKERANALRYLNRYDEALTAARLAEDAYEWSATPDLDRAGVAIVRAAVLIYLERFSEATALLPEMRRVFRAYGESERLRHTDLLEAVIRTQTGEIPAARDLFLEVLTQARSAHDLPTIARVCANLANCYRDLGDYEEAAGYFQQGISLYEDLGLRTEQARLRWALAKLLLQRGKLADAEGLLARTEAEFRGLGMDDEASMVGLHQVEVLLAEGQTAGLADRCRELGRYFATIGVRSAADTALVFLQEALRAGTATPATVRHVRKYVEALAEQPELRFTPPE